ncbi:MAG: hypothetical protein WC369_06225 [Dehalococcoidales bacterium]|jgi:hypothetical protein
MAEVTAEMVQRRLETVASGTYAPEIPGLPGIVFVKMGLKEKGISSRAYSSKLKELMAVGGYFNEALLPSILQKACRENGLDIGVMKKQRAILKRFYDSIPKDLSGPYDQLTPEEVVLLSPEEQEERQKGIGERGRRIMEWQESFFTEEDHLVMDQARQIEQLEQHLKANTAEHHARKFRDETEILACARREDGVKPYFGSIEEIGDLEDRNRDALIQLYSKWAQFKAGLTQQFFRPDNLN